MPSAALQLCLLSFEERKKKKKKKGLLSQIKVCLAKVKPILQPELFQLPTGQAGIKFSTWQCQGQDPWGSSCRDARDRSPCHSLSPAGCPSETTKPL